MKDLRRYIQSITYAGTDGVNSTFALLLGMVGSSLPNPIILRVLLLAVLSNALSMSVSDFNSQATDTKVWTEKRTTSAAMTFGSMFLFSIIPILFFLTYKKSRSSPLIIGFAAFFSHMLLALFHGWAIDSYHHVPSQVGLSMLVMFAAYYIGVWSGKLFKNQT